MSDERVQVVDARGRALSPCEARRAEALVAAGRGRWLSGGPPTVQLPYEVEVPAPVRGKEGAIALGTPLLLHICCGPCATYPVPRLRELGFEVVGYWYNPNIQPPMEHVLREESGKRCASRLGLLLICGAYEPERFEEAVRGHEERPERCRRCYRLRLEETAREAQARNMGHITTTLLISPYQDLAAIREIGEEVAGRHGLRFYFENLRRGWAERSRLAREYGLYQQQYCGCRFSLAERRRAWRRQPIPVAEEG